MNHILQKKQKISQLEQEKRSAREAIIQFRAHLQSSKFHEDTTIQVSEVERWLENINAALI